MNLDMGNDDDLELSSLDNKVLFGKRGGQITPPAQPGLTVRVSNH